MYFLLSIQFWHICASMSCLCYFSYRIFYRVLIIIFRIVSVSCNAYFKSCIDMSKFMRINKISQSCNSMILILFQNRWTVQLTGWRAVADNELTLPKSVNHPLTSVNWSAKDIKITWDFSFCKFFYAFIGETWRF